MKSMLPNRRGVRVADLFDGGVIFTSMLSEGGLMVVALVSDGPSL